MKRSLFGTSEYRPVLFVLLFVALFSQALIFAVYRDINERTLNRSRAELKTQAKNMSQILEETSTAAIQLIEAANAMTQKQSNASEIETTLQQLLSSATSEAVYGMGAWAKPYGFNKTKKFFGPYVHQREIGLQSQTNLVLTYEWDTNEYNYPQQSWYKSGEQARDFPIFTNPYIDAGMTWVSLTRAWIDAKGQARGVLTVDLVLPELQALIEKFNKGSSYHIYLTTKDDKLLAHPLMSDFVRLALISKTADLINLPLKEYIQAENKLWNMQEMETVAEPIKNLEWKLVVKAERSQLLASADGMTWLLAVSGGSMVALVGIAWIVLLRISRQLDLARANSATSAKMASLGEMAGGVAHELNTPLTVIGLLSAQIQKGAKNSDLNHQELHEKLVNIDAATEKAASIIRSLRVFSRDASEDSFDQVDLQTVFRDTMSICQQGIASNGIDLIMDFPTGSIFFQGRAPQISQVILNLINNSVEALRTAETKWIRISVVQIAGKVDIRFKDSGTLSTKAKAKLFQPFFTTKEPGQGTGLGLSTSRQIVTTHGGRLYLDETEQQTCFVMTLPLTSDKKISVA